LRSLSPPRGARDQRTARARCPAAAIEPLADGSAGVTTGRATVTRTSNRARRATDRPCATAADRPATGHRDDQIEHERLAHPRAHDLLDARAVLAVEAVGDAQQPGHLAHVAAVLLSTAAIH